MTDEPRDRIPVDTTEPPHEPAVKSVSTVGVWAVVLSGPALWITQFLVVYLVAEVACAAERSARLSLVPADRVEIVIVAATLIAALLAVVGGVMSHRRLVRPGAPGLYRVGELLSGLSVVAILAVGLPILVLPVCT